jgi:hypothetical protein
MITSLASGKRFSTLDWMTLDGDAQLLSLVIIVLIVILLGRINFRLGWPW